MNNPYAVPSQSPTPMPSPKPPKKSSKILTYGGGCLGAFFGLFILAGIIGSLAPDSKTNPSPSATASAMKPVLVVPTSKPVPTPTPSATELRRIRAEKKRQEKAERRRLAAERKEAAKQQLIAEAKAQKEKEEAEARAIEAERTDGVVSRAEYNRIRSGMSYSEVADIIGDGTEISRSDMAGYTTEMYSWENPSGGGNMNAMFQNDELISKAQFGLE